MLKLELDHYKKRFNMAKGVVKMKPPRGKRVDCFSMVYIAALQVLTRAKYLFISTLEEDARSNAYACYVLVRAYFETVVALGYLEIQMEGNISKKDYRGVWNLAHRLLMGGKHFPTEEHLKEMKKERVPAANVYDYLDKVDEYLRKVQGLKDKSFAPHREMYDSALSEFGHPNYLGLVICSQLKKDKSGNLREVINMSKSMGKGDKDNYLGYLNWGSLTFFLFWDKLVLILKNYGLELPVLK